MLVSQKEHKVNCVPLWWPSTWGVNFPSTQTFLFQFHTICYILMYLVILCNLCFNNVFTSLVYHWNYCVIQVDNNKKLGEWAGLCKIDKDGKARKIVGCSCVVIKVSNTSILIIIRIVFQKNLIVFWVMIFYDFNIILRSARTLSIFIIASDEIKAQNKIEWPYGVVPLARATFLSLKHLRHKKIKCRP